MEKDEEGYFYAAVEYATEGTRYFYRHDDGNEYPDPASRFQPEGVHGPSEVVNDHSFQWSDHNWKTPDLKELVIYELHTGVFSDQGTFEGIIAKLDDLRDTGINAIELMPVNQFPGSRNWGYDGVFPYAVQHSYGGPAELKKLVNACHEKNMAVLLDVVYNHLGPEGNYFRKYGPYFTNRYSTPWGDALNFDGEWCDGVRDFFAGNALYWFEHFHIDGLRCDAIHSVTDNSAIHFWEYTNTAIRQLEQKLGKTFHMIAESDLNSPKVIREVESGGYGFTAQWLDDFHHSLYTILDKQGKERYEDYGSLEQLAKGYTDGFVLSGEWVKFRKKKYGASSAGISGDKFIVFNQNHDQIGNRVKGERLCELVDGKRLKVAAAAILLAPYVPMLFMGEEYADESPFYYFISHSDKDLIEAVRKGRKEEFAGFGFETGPPDPQDEQTFRDCRLQWSLRNKGKHRVMLDWHKKLIEVRKNNEALMNFDKRDLTVEVLGQDALLLHRKGKGGQQLVCLFNFAEKEVVCAMSEDEARFKKILDSADEGWLFSPGEERFHLPGELTGTTLVMPPLTVAVYERLT